ncbi:MAG TPA: MFS transporter, partial [Phototrophicaceae bacterium]|nr:MFS transporter [Phototrophicaceae bacterium]
LGLMALCVLVAARLPAPPRNLGEKPPRANLRQFVTDRRWLGFLGGIFLFGSALAVLYIFFCLYLKTLGVGEGLFGAAIAVASVSELPIFFLSAWMLRKWTASGLIKTAFWAVMIRCFLYAVIRNPLGLIPVQLLHGLCFSAMWAASVNYVNELAPAGMGASAQSLFGATLFGLGGAAGALFGSQIYALLGPTALFQAAGVTALVGLVLFSITELAFHKRTHPAATAQE